MPVSMAVHPCADDLPIVAVGASAGGIGALRKLVGSLRGDVPYAMVVLQHLPPNQPSRLAELLRVWTHLPVLEARDGLQPEPGHIYVPSPDSILMLEAGVFRTRPAAGGASRPGIDTIDAFLESVAARHSPRAVAVVLSGTGMDGTAGAVSIRQAGGVVIVQDPLTAQHDSMPASVIQRGIHDHVLPVSAIGRQLLACFDEGYTRPAASRNWESTVAATLERILSLIRREAGFDLSGYRPSPLLWRIQQRMEVRRVRSFEDYAWLVEDEPVELESLVRGLPIHVTEFFRDAVAWDTFRNEVLEPLINENNGTPLRIWTPACATGEEAYSVAMLLDEIVHDSGHDVDYQIFATDAAPEAVVRASRGCYRAETCATMDPTRLSRYFYTVDGRCRIKRFLRERMVFAVQDVISDPPISAVDVVTCRNLLIYLEPDTIKKVLRTLNGALRMGGFLFLGASEPHAAEKLGFAAVSTRWNIHRKVESVGALKQSPAPSRGTVLASLVRTAAERNHVPAVLIDEECNLLRLYGDTAGILNLPAGEPSLNLLRLVNGNWVGQLRAAVSQALGSAQACAFDGSVARDGKVAHLTVSVTPLEPASDGNLNRVLVSFNTRDDGGEHPVPVNPGDAGSREAHRPWTEWEEDLRISREELDASREELQALNEELKAANADLNASNRELNEANVDLKEKIAEIKMQSDVLSSGAVMTVFLDRDQKIRWFTPAISQIIPIQPKDVGRCVSDLTPSFHDPLFASDIHAVLATGAQSDAVVSRSGDRWLLRRIYPHRSSEGVMLGVAITFADVTDRTRAEHGLERSKIWLSAQKEAFQSAMNGDSLQISLGFLLQSLLDQAADDRRCAFYIAQGETLHHVVGMPEEYAKCVNGFVISPESLACGLAVATGTPVITPDVLKDPRWQPWTWLALRFNYRGCWSFPVETSAGHLVGSLAMYFERPREPTALDLELATAFTHTAGIIMSQHHRAEPCAS